MPQDDTPPVAPPAQDPVLQGLQQLAIDPQEEVPAEFAQRVLAQADAGPPPRQPWHRWRWLMASRWGLPALAIGLVLSLAGNLWLGLPRLGPEEEARPRRESSPAGTSHRVQVAFREGVREQEVRLLLLSLRATILGGPSAQGVYVVQVPLPQLRLRDLATPVSLEERLRQLLEELRAQPAVRLAEPAIPAE